MEKTKRAAVVPCDIGWADVGSWDEIWRLSEQDEAGNVALGESEVIDGANNLLHSEGVAIYAVGVRDLIVVATPDTVIILPRERAQEVKALRERARGKSDAKPSESLSPANPWRHRRRPRR